MFSFDASIQKVGRIELQPRLIRKNRQDAPAFRLEDLCRFSNLPLKVSYHPIVIVPFSKEKLFRRIVDPAADNAGVRNPSVCLPQRTIRLSE